MQGARIQYLVRELRFHRLCGMAKKKKRQKFNKKKKKKNNIKKKESIHLNIDKKYLKIMHKVLKTFRKW